MSSPKAQILRPVRITPHGVRQLRRARSENPFDYELLIPVNGELDEFEALETTPTLDFEVDEDGLRPDDARITVNTPHYDSGEPRAQSSPTSPSSESPAKSRRPPIGDHR